MIVKIRTPKESKTISSVSESSTLQQLLEEISFLSQIAVPQLKLKVGFPPKYITTVNNESCTLQQLNIRNGETIIVEEDTSIQIVPSTKTIQPITFENYVSKLELPPKPKSDSNSSTESLSRDCFVVRRIIAADNSCLFSAFCYGLLGGESRKRASSYAKALRKFIAEYILSNPLDYNEAVLGKDPNEYATWIQQSDSWGGALELRILSDAYQIQINALEIQSCRMDSFGEDSHHALQIFLLYDGIHYDALALCPIEDGSEEMDITLFSSTDSIASQKCLQLVKQLQKQHQFTDLSGFTLKCMICGQGLKGQKEASIHAMQTKHTNFSEYK